MRVLHYLCLVVSVFFHPAVGLASAASAAVALKDHSSVAVGLFNNMRTPAALIGGALVPLGILSAPVSQQGDSKRLKMFKKATFLLGIVSLLNQVLAVTYSSIAINKLVEVPQPPTLTVAELITENHELPWLGTNIHFILGLMGFTVVVGSKAYFMHGGNVGKIGMGWTLAASLQAASLVNRGIAQGSGGTEGVTVRFASNLFSLILRYGILAIKNAKGGFFAMAAIAVAAYSTFLTIKFLLNESEE